MENKDDGENDENTYWVGCVQIRTASEDWMYYYYIFDGDGNCVANGRETDTLYCWPEETGKRAGYSYRQGDYFVGYDCQGEQIFKVPIQNENQETDTDIINVRPVDVNGKSYYQYWDQAVGNDVYDEDRKFGILDASGKIIWDAGYGVEMYKGRPISRDALKYGKVVYEDADTYVYNDKDEKWEMNYLDYNYVYDLETGEFLGKYDDCVAVSDDSLCIAYTDGDGVGHATMYMKDGKEFEVILDELTGAKQWSVKKIEGSDTYGFYGYKKASYAFPLKEKRGWAASPDTWERGWNLGGQCAVIVDEQGNKLQSAVADSVYVNEEKMEIMTLKNGDYVKLPVKPLRTPSPDSSQEESPSSKVLPDKIYTGFRDGIEQTVLLRQDVKFGDAFLYMKVGEGEFDTISWGNIRDCGVDQYGVVWWLDGGDLSYFGNWGDDELGSSITFYYGSSDVAALIFESSGSQSIVTGYETYSGEIHPLLTFDEMRVAAGLKSDISTPVYIPSQNSTPGADNPPAETVAPPSNGTGNPSASITVPSVGTASQRPFSVAPNQSSKVLSPAKVLWKSAKNIKGRKVVLAYKKAAAVKGYQIIYATDKKFSKNKKSVFTSKTSYKAAKLKKGKTYYFKVRAYRVDDGKKVYGAWSGTKKIKVKK